MPFNMIGKFDVIVKNALEYTNIEAAKIKMFETSKTNVIWKTTKLGAIIQENLKSLIKNSKSYAIQLDSSMAYQGKSYRLV